MPVNLSCETGVPGLFAAGDITAVPEKPIVIATGEGAKPPSRRTAIYRDRRNKYLSSYWSSHILFAADFRNPKQHSRLQI